MTLSPSLLPEDVPPLTSLLDGVVCLKMMCCTGCGMRSCCAVAPDARMTLVFRVLGQMLSFGIAAQCSVDKVPV